MDTLLDYLRDGLRIVSVGLNPSLRSMSEGYYFANPRNRFWKALNQSELVSGMLHPGVSAQKILFVDHGIGFTDVVKRPSAGISELRAADYRKGAPALRKKLLRYQPTVAWFHGKEAYRHYLKYTDVALFPLNWGEQRHRIGRSLVFVTPNPSPANAAFSLGVLVDWYDQLALFVSNAATST